jgi:antitoxin VapB
VSLNIKDREAHKLAIALAEQTGETMTEAVKVALRERLERVRRSKRKEVRVAELLEIGRRCAQHLKRPPIDHGELLYDEKGLPR